MKHILKKSVNYLHKNVGRRRPLAYVGGWLGKCNLGDEALFQAAQELFSDVSLWHFDGSRTLTTLVKRLPFTKNGLFAGGTLINRCPEYLAVANRFLHAKRDLYIFGTGVADPAFWLGRGDFKNMLKDWRKVLDQCSYVGVRGPRSAELLTDAGVTNVEIVGDPVIFYADDHMSDEVKPDSIGLNIGYDHGNQWGDERQLSREVLSLAKLAKKAGWSIKWFVVFPRDLAITQQLAKETGTSNNICCVYDDPRRYLDEVRSMSTFIGMKLHATMLATCAHVPSLMLEYAPKCLDYMKSIGQCDSVIRTDRFRAAKAWDVLKTWNSERAIRSRFLHAKITLLKQSQIKKAKNLSGRMFRSKVIQRSE